MDLLVAYLVFVAKVAGLAHLVSGLPLPICAAAGLVTGALMLAVAHLTATRSMRVRPPSGLPK